MASLLLKLHLSNRDEQALNFDVRIKQFRHNQTTSVDTRKQIYFNLYK